MGIIFAFMLWHGIQTANTTSQIILDERRALARAMARDLDHDLEQIVSHLAQVAVKPTMRLGTG